MQSAEMQGPALIHKSHDSLLHGAWLTVTVFLDLKREHESKIDNKKNSGQAAFYSLC